MLRVWQEEPGDAVQQLQRLPDVIERVSIISSIIDHHPGETGALCEMLPHGISKERCLSVNANPEMWSMEGSVSGQGVRAGPGPASSVWSSDDFETSAFIRTRGDPRVCADEVDSHGCVWGWARVHAKAGDVEDVAKVCASIHSAAPDPGLWRYACFLSSATHHVSIWDRVRLSDTAQLCGASGGFRALCAERVIHRLASLAPPSDVGDGRAWSDHLMRASAIGTAWASSSMREQMIDRFWAQSMAVSASKARGLSGDALDVLPAAAVPHLRAALAWEWMSRLDEVSDFETLRTGLLELMALRLARKPTAIAPGTVVTMPDLWPIDREGEAHLAAVSYFGQSRRTLARDPRADAGLCVMEAAARLESPALGLIRTGLSSADERLRWTSARLLEQLEGAH